MRWAIVALLCVAWAAVTYPLTARFVLHGPVTADSLTVSVGRTAGSAGELLGDDGECGRRGESWRCTVVDTEGSGGAEYRVRVRPGSSCWTAELVLDASEQGMPRAMDDCVRRWQWSVL